MGDDRLPGPQRSAREASRRVSRRRLVAFAAVIALAAAVVVAFAVGSHAAPVASEARAVAAASKASRPVCPPAWRATWQKLADRIGTPVYCPAWLPDPLTGDIGGRWNTIDSVQQDRSYLLGFAWQETGPGAAGGELHVNLRAYPGSTAIPVCPDTVTSGGTVTRRQLPCFDDARGTKRANGIVATVYTVNQGADQWHVLYAWQLNGTLYTLSQHVAPPLTYRQVVADLDRELASLELVRPRG